MGGFLNTDNLRPVPFERGNKLGEVHGFYSQILTPVDEAEAASESTRQQACAL